MIDKASGDLHKMWIASCVSSTERFHYSFNFLRLAGHSKESLESSQGQVNGHCRKIDLTCKVSINVKQARK